MGQVVKLKAKKPSWFGMRALANGRADISILGEIGMFGVTAEDFNNQLDALGDISNIQININSDGGDVYQGFAIYNMLQLHPANKTVTILGLAASMGSVIAMAGNVRKMPKNAVMMIHNPVGGIFGEADEIVSFGEAVEAMRNNIAQAYVDASGGKLNQKTALALMDKQSWLGAEECLALGLATEVLPAVEIAAKFDISRFRNAPDSYGALSKGAKSMAKEKTNTNTNDDEFESAPTAEALAQARKEERESILKNNKDISALCRIAGRPELAAKFQEDAKTVDEVVAELDKLKTEKKPASGSARRNGGEEISARHQIDDDGEKATVDVDPTKIWNKWNRSGARA